MSICIVHCKCGGTLTKGKAALKNAGHIGWRYPQVAGGKQDCQVFLRQLEDQGYTGIWDQLYDVVSGVDTYCYIVGYKPLEGKLRSLQYGEVGPRYNVEPNSQEIIRQIVEEYA